MRKQTIEELLVLNARYVEVSTRFHSLIETVVSLIPSKLHRPGGLMSQLIEVEGTIAKLSSLIQSEKDENMHYLSDILQSIIQSQERKDAISFDKDRSALHLCDTCFQPLSFVTPWTSKTFPTSVLDTTMSPHPPCEYIASKRTLPA